MNRNRTLRIVLFLLVFSCKSIFGQISFEQHVIVNNFQGATGIAADDLDGDGDIDIVGTGTDGHHVSWLENDGNQVFTQHLICDTLYGATGLDIADMDSDGDVDIVATAITGDRIAWFENDNSGNFTEYQVIESWAGPSYVCCFDVNQDGFMDIVATSCKTNKICWFENNRDQSFTEHILKENWRKSNYATVVDIDSDGDMDIIGISKRGEIIWFDNDGDENFSEIQIYNWGGSSSIQAGDIDLDGDIDLAVTSCEKQKLAWFENQGEQNFAQHIIRNDFPGARSVRISDFDQDGFIDILAVAWGKFTSDNQYGFLSFFKNDGEQNFSESIICDKYTAYDLITIFITDLDQDDDLDIVGATYHHHEIRWWENLGNPSAIQYANRTTAPDEIILSPNFPNPFNPKTNISYQLFTQARVRVWILNANGQCIRKLNDSIQEMGTYTISWEGHDDNGRLMPSGIYFCKLAAGSLVKTKKMILIQ